MAGKDHVRQIRRMLEDIEDTEKASHVLYLSSILGTRVFDERARHLGRIKDIAIDPVGGFPKAVAVIVKKWFLRRRTLSWEGFDLGEFPQRLVVRAPLPLSQLPRNCVFVGDKILDQQLVDTNGIKIIRANDVAFIPIHNTLFLASISIGLKGLLRRIGLNTDGWSMKENLVPWAYVEPLEGKFRDIKLKISESRLGDIHPADFADLLEKLAREQRLSLFRNLSNRYASRILDEADAEVRMSLVSEIPQRRLVHIFTLMYEGNVADILLSLPEAKRRELLVLMGPAEARHFQLLMSCNKESAGRFMTRKFITVLPQDSAREIIRKIQASDPPRVLHAVYVVKHDLTLVGTISLRNLLISPSGDPASKLLKKKLVYVRKSAHKNVVYSMMAKYDLTSIPVVDRKHRIIGVINVEDLLKERVYVPAKQDAEQV